MREGLSLGLSWASTSFNITIVVPFIVNQLHLFLFCNSSSLFGFHYNSIFCSSSLVRPAGYLPIVVICVMEDWVNSRLDIHEEQLQQLQSTLEDIRSVWEVDRLEERNFRKFMLNWIQQQEKKSVGVSILSSDSEPYVTDPVTPTSLGEKQAGEDISPFQSTLESSSGLPIAVKEEKLPEFFGFDPQGWLQKANVYFAINGTPLHLRIRLAQLCMTGVAAHWFKIVKQFYDPLTWEQFQKELFQRFKGLDLDIQNPCEQLVMMKQQQEQGQQPLGVSVLTGEGDSHTVGFMVGSGSPLSVGVGQLGGSSVPMVNLGQPIEFPGVVKKVELLQQFSGLEIQRKFEQQPSIKQSDSRLGLTTRMFASRISDLEMVMGLQTTSW